MIRLVGWIAPVTDTTLPQCKSGRALGTMLYITMLQWRLSELLQSRDQLSVMCGLISRNNKPQLGKQNIQFFGPNDFVHL